MRIQIRFTLLRCRLCICEVTTPYSSSTAPYRVMASSVFLFGSQRSHSRKCRHKSKRVGNSHCHPRCIYISNSTFERLAMAPQHGMSTHPSIIKVVTFVEVVAIHDSAFETRIECGLGLKDVTLVRP
jgi:hypothetical protein